jgi:hypothetical protein
MLVCDQQKPSMGVETEVHIALLKTNHFSNKILIQYALWKCVHQYIVYRMFSKHKRNRGAHNLPPMHKVTIKA